MSSQERGTKRFCQSCCSPFYDLNRDSFACPKCGTTWSAASTSSKPKRTRSTAKETVVAPVFDALEGIEIETSISEEEDVLLEDPDDLGDEEDVVVSLDHHDDKESG